MSGWLPPDDEVGQDSPQMDTQTYGMRRHSYGKPSALWTGASLCMLTFTAIVALFLLALSLGTYDGLGIHPEDAHAAHAITTIFTTITSILTSTSIVTVTALPESSITPGPYAGPTATASVQPFLAQADPVPFGTIPAYKPNEPLQTYLPIANLPNDTSIFQLTGHLSPYFPSPGFGANEYSLPPGTNITAVHVLHRHGSRYPTSSSSVSSFGEKVREATANGTAQWSGALSFLNTWSYQLGAEILTNKGHQELFDSGVLHSYSYGALYNPSTKIVARTTTQDRMLTSARYFMAGFFGLDHSQNVTIQAQIEWPNFNTSLAGYYQCPNSYNFRSGAGGNASDAWRSVYLQDATARLQALSGNYEWTVADSYDAQTLCPYETVAFGYSPWCELFTYEEWQGFEYSIDLEFHGDAGFGSPSARAVGIGYVQEFLARLQGHLYDLPEGATQVNYTLDTSESTFPTNQSLYFDFSHDTNIMSVITAFGLRQFAGNLSTTTMSANRSMIVSHLTPFAARVVWEVIQAPQPVKATRPVGSNAASADYYDEGEVTNYVHLLIGQRTVPLHRSYPECAIRDDGWCDMKTFMDVMNTMLATARYEYSCFGDYPVVPGSQVTDGVPIVDRSAEAGDVPAR